MWQLDTQHLERNSIYHELEFQVIQERFVPTFVSKEDNQLSPIQYGLDPAQLREVYPELVYEDEEGNISINYVEMVPLLVQSINELTQRIDTLWWLRERWQ